MNFSDYCSKFESNDKQKIKYEGDLITFTNSSGQQFIIDPKDAMRFLETLSVKNSDFLDKWNSVGPKKPITKYEQNPYRAIYKFASEFDGLKIFDAHGSSQTKPLTQVLSKLICFLSGGNYSSVDENTFFDLESIAKALERKPGYMKFLQDKPVNKEMVPVKRRFIDWLESQGLSEKSIYSYAETGLNRCQVALTEMQYPISNIFDLTSANAKEAFEVIKRNQTWVEANDRGNGMYSAAMARYVEFLEKSDIGPLETFCLSKPFILLAGISGTGKSRLIRKQANHNCKLIVPVRPDWHEPSDLLGYVSRISGRPEYVATDTLRFMAKAWKDAFLSASPEGVILKRHSEMQTFWLCLDEMNLAPVEQYFADYLSVLESREWKGGTEDYKCDPILRIPDGVDNIRAALGLEAPELDGLWSYFNAVGMPLPPNLIVAGTVNMDETTHGFSRKVIDRALTFDFGEFFPNTFDDFFGQSTSPVKLSFPTITHISDSSELADAKADKNGGESIKFLVSVNTVLVGTPFELAFRALNELLLSVYFHSPADDAELQAVWDDFIMMKVLPRIEGDNEKLASRTESDANVIELLERLLTLQLIGDDKKKRVDFYRVDQSGQRSKIEFRSIHKLQWMQQRLRNNGFTSFWP